MEENIIWEIFKKLKSTVFELRKEKIVWHSVGITGYSYGRKQN